MTAAPEHAPRRYQIGDLVLDTGLCSVTREYEKLDIGGLTFEMLLALVDASPSIARYEYLVDRVWQGRKTSADTIAQRARMLRAALSDEASDPRYFELIRGQGYRMVADVSLITDRAKKRRLRKQVGFVIAAVVTAAILWFSYDAMRDDEITPSVAILPFADLSEQGDQRYLADGIAEELINELAALDGLDVASRTDSFFHPGPTENLAEVGEMLNVAAILEGSVRKSGDSIRITVQLVEVDSGFHLWSQNFNSDTQDILSIQETIARSVAGALGVKLGVGGVNEFVGAGTRNFDAYEAFLRGDYEKALKTDPDYAAAFARNGVRIASTMYGNMPEDAPDIIERAYPYAVRAIELDPSSAQAHADFAALSSARMEWARAEQSYSYALQLDRSVETISAYGNMMLRVGRVRTAIDLYREADALRHRPWPPRRLANEMRSHAYMALQDVDAADRYTPHMHEQVRLFNKLMIAINFGEIEDVRRAIRALPKAAPDYYFLYEPILDLLGTPDEAIAFMLELANDQGREWPYKYEAIAVLAAHLGDPDVALQVFSRELRVTTIRYGTLWLPVMSDMRKLPEFKELLIEVGLIGYWQKSRWSDFCRPDNETEFVCD